MPLRLTILTVLAAASPSVATPVPPVTGPIHFEEPLPAGALARMGSAALRGGKLTTPAFSPDGKTIRTVGTGVFRVWDAATYREVARYGRTDWQPEPFVLHAYPSRDGKTVALLVETRIEKVIDRAIVVWDAVTRKPARTLAVDWQYPLGKPALVAGPARGPVQGPVIQVNRWAISPDGRELALLGQNLLTLPLTEANPKLKNYGPSPAPWSGLFEYTPDGKALFGGWQPPVLWDAATGKQIRSYGEPEHRAVGLPPTVSPDGKRIGVVHLAPPAGFGNPPGRPILTVWDAATGKQAASVESPPDTDRIGGRKVQLSPDGRSAFRFEFNQQYSTLRAGRWWLPDQSWSELWSVSSSELPLEYAFSPDARTVAVGWNSSVRLFDSLIGTEHTPCSAASGSVIDVAVPVDRAEVLVASLDGRVTNWDRDTGQLRQTWAAPVAWQYYGALPPRLSANGKYVATYAYDELGRGVNLTRVGGSRTRLASESLPLFLADGNELLTLQDVGGLNVRDTATGKIRTTLPIRPNFMHVSSDGKMLLTETIMEVAGWDLTTAKRQYFWSLAEVNWSDLPLFSPNRGVEAGKGYCRIVSRALSPDGQRLAVTLAQFPNPQFPAYEALVVVCEAATGKLLWRKEVRAFSQLYAQLNQLELPMAFRPDGKTLAVGTWKVELFDAETGTAKGAFDGHRGQVTALRFSSDGKRLASGGSDGVALIWDTSAE